MVDRVAGALLDLLELQLMPRADAGDEVIQTADDHEPVIAAGAQVLQRLQHELALDRLIADLGRDIRDDQVDWLIRRALQARRCQSP